MISSIDARSAMAVITCRSASTTRTLISRNWFNHANYLRFMERGRTNYLRLLGTDHRALFEENPERSTRLRVRGALDDNRIPQGPLTWTMCLISSPHR